MVLQNGEINIIADMEGTTGVKLHNNRQKLRSRFDIVKKLGQGTYGKVQLAINKDTGEEVAIKTIKKSKIETEQDLVRIQREIQIMSSVQHPHIIHIYEVFENREKIVLVMEYASGGELYDYISYKKVLDEIEARRVFRQVAAAVFYCHKNMICHRDLKLENILLDERGCAKIADFGLSNVFDERNFLSTFCGSPLYASPEIVRGIPYYGPEVDCWSLGVLLYTLCYGAMPFDGSNFKKLVRQISEGDYYEPKAPSEASHLIRRMLTVDPAKRANIDDICCDVWVDMGEDTPLWEIAEEMCKQMPVRLDYLLTLTAAAAAASAAAATAASSASVSPHPDLSIPPPPPPLTLSEGEIASTLHQEEATEGTDQWERPVMAEAMSTDVMTEMMPIEQDVEKAKQKKHKLTATASSLAIDDAVKKKKLDNEDSLNEDVQVESPDHSKSGVVDGEKESEKPVLIENSESTVSAKNADPLSEDATKVVSAADDADKQLGSSSRERSPVKKKVVSSVKRLSLPNSGSKLNKSVSEVASSLSNSNQTSGSLTPPSSSGKGVSRLSLKKSTSSVQSMSKDGIGSSGSEILEKRKLSFPSLRPVNVEAKKTLEAKAASAEVKPLMGIVLKKVSAVRKPGVETPSPSNTPSPEVSKITTKSHLTKKPVVAEFESKTAPSKDVETSDTTDGNKKQTGPIVRQGSLRKFGVPPRASVSPTKAVGPRTQQQQQQQTHQGCVPHEPKMAAEEEIKKKSPTKSLFSNKSPPTSAASSTSESPTRKTRLTKAPSFTKLAPATSLRRTSAPGNGTTSSSSVGKSSVSSNTAIVRPRSPAKTSKERPSSGTISSIPGAQEQLELIDRTQISKPDEKTEVEANAEGEGEDDTSLSLSKKMESVGISSVGKRGSIEIAPLPIAEIEKDAPQITFVPRDKGQFTLLGVKSEVMFDVVTPDDDDVVLDEHNSTSVQDKSASSKLEKETERQKKGEEKEKDGDNSKIIRYVATVRRHGSEDNNNDPFGKGGPERVTLLNIRRSETAMSVDSSKECESDQTSSASYKTVENSVQRQDSRYNEQVSSKTGSTSSVTSSNAEQRGYSVYRSKYRSVQKYRSVVERRNSERDANAVDDDDGEGVDVPAGALGRSSSKSNVDVEHSDSFSSAGSADDLEVFESLTSESLFTSLLNRTRNLIERIADGDDESPFFRSSLLTRRFLGGASENLTSNSAAAMSLLLHPPTISFRRNPVSSLNIGYNYDPLGSRGNNTARSPPESDIGMRRWRSSRSSTRSGVAAASEDSKLASTMSGSGGGGSCNIRLRARASFNSNDYSSSGSHQSRHQSRYESFRNQDQDHVSSMTSSIADSANRRREEARSDIISALLRHRNSSLDGRRPRSLYDGSDEYLSTKSSSPHDTNYHHCAHDPYMEEVDRHQDVTNVNNVYATVRRPINRYPRYTKSMTKEMNADDYDSDLRRPRSIHEILSSNLVNGDDTINHEADADATSVSRDYSKSGSKSVSRNGATKREEEEEFEREHRVTEGAVGRSVTTTQRQVSRSISQTDEEDKSCSSSSVHHVHTSSTLLQRRPTGSKTDDDDDGISRQDSGLGSLYDGGTLPSSAAVRRRAGLSRGGIDNDLESLEKEMSRFGLRRQQLQESNVKQFAGSSGDQTPDGFVQMSSGVEAAKTSGDGATTPANSDSADTGSVCSDASGTATETSSSTVKASEEESVGERIRRKSFFARFNDTASRVPRKVRNSMSSSSSTAATSSHRSDLGRSSSLRHRILDDDSFATTRLHYDSPPDFYGISSRYNPQRWSMHPGGSVDPDFMAAYVDPGVPLSPRRRSFQGAGVDHMSTSSSYLRRPASGSWMDDNYYAPDNLSPSCGRATSPHAMSRTHSLPEEGSNGNGIDNGDPRGAAMHRQSSVPGNSPGIPPPSPARRPNHLAGLYSTIHREEADEWLSPDSPSTSTTSRGNSWSTRPSSSSPSAQRQSSTSTAREPSMDGRSRLTASSLASSLMDNLDSPSEVLQKAMDLCDSLRYST